MESKFFNQKVAKTSKNDYQTIEDKYYKSLANYNLIDHQDYYSLSSQYANKIGNNRDLILNENFYLLRKL